MRYPAVPALIALVALAGCDDEPVEPIEEEPYEVITLKKLTTRANFVDLNDNGQALWREDGQPILWDDGRIWEVSVGSYLGPDGAILGTVNERAALWRDGMLTRLPGSPMGFGADGTVYYARSDTVFSWRDGIEEATGLPVGIGLISPDGRVFRYEWDEDGEICFVYRAGEWESFTRLDEICRIVMAASGGWTFIRTRHWHYVAWPDNSIAYSVSWADGPSLEHINAVGFALGKGGEVIDVRTDSVVHLTRLLGLEGFRAGAINDAGAVLGQLEDEVVLLIPR